jgi:O-succinylbenzoic acid--CoA ligase
MVSERPLHAVLAGPDGLLGPLEAALDGTGPAVAPVDPALPRPQLERLLAELKPDAVRTPDGLVRGGPGGQAGGAGAQAGGQAGGGEGGCEAGGEGRGQPADGDTAVVIVTSGSTGRPKAVELSAAALLASAGASLDRIGARPGERWLCCLPASHVAGIQVLVRSLVTGTTPLTAGRLDPALVASCGGAHVSMVPTQLRRLIDAGAGLDCLGTILLGGAGAPARLLADAAAAGGRVVTTYGMTETCGGCVYDGIPLDGVRVVAGPDGRIRVAGPVLFTRYRGQPGLTREALAGGWFTTSDLGTVGPSGRVTIRGRADDVINTGGEKVIAAEVAAVLETCPQVRAAAVIGRPDDEWGERVTAVVVPADPAAPPALETLRAHVRRVMPPFAAPRELMLVAELPLLSSGKPDLRALRGRGSPSGQRSREH